MDSLINPSKELGYSNIFLDFVSGTSQVNKFYPAGSLDDVALSLGKHSYFRKEMAAILTDQNKSFGATDEVFENIDKLESDNCLTIFTGQQAGLLGGPLLVLIKALSIVKAAKFYSKKLKRPVIPIFWIAGDDHDYEEVNHTCLLNKEGEIEKICYSTIPKIENSTAELIFSNTDQLNHVKEQVKNLLGQTDFTDELYDLIDRSYTENDSYVTAFGKLMSALTSKYGLILFSPGDPKVKQLAVDFFKKIVKSQDDIHECLTDTNKQMLSNGYHLQVEKKDESTHLFYNLDGRKPVLRDNGNFIVGDKSFTEDQMLELIENSPEKFSPDVMTRPLFQSYLFPVISQKGGAAEIAYLAQINKLFNLFDIPIPYYKARPTLTIIEKKFEKIINEYDITFSELTGDIEQLINRILAKSFPEDIEARFNHLRSHIREHFKDFSDSTLKFDPALKNFSEQSLGKIDYTLNMYEKKVFSSHKKKSAETRAKIYRLWHSVYPNRNFQERTLNVSYFLARYGFNFVDFLYEKIDCEQSAHQLVHLSEYNG